eukprot:29825-Pelagococcus_subviridis.AAC.3
MSTTASTPPPPPPPPPRSSVAFKFKFDSRRSCVTFRSSSGSTSRRMVSTSAPPTPSATHSGVDGAREATNVGVELKGVRGGVERRRVGVSGLKPRRGGRRDAPGDKVSPQGTAFTTPTRSYYYKRAHLHVHAEERREPLRDDPREHRTARGGGDGAPDAGHERVAQDDHASRLAPSRRRRRRRASRVAPSIADRSALEVVPPSPRAAAGGSIPAASASSRRPPLPPRVAAARDPLRGRVRRARQRGVRGVKRARLRVGERRARRGRARDAPRGAAHHRRPPRGGGAAEDRRGGIAPAEAA